jgi:AcrR family transcriptional regulator
LLKERSVVGRDTRDRILNAAERLFAEKGFRETTLRDVATAAAVNAGSLYHFFKTKVSLIQAVFSRRLIPQDQERLRRLRLYEAAAAPDHPSVEAILHALIGPMFDAAGESPLGSHHFMKLMVQAYAETNAEVLEAIDRGVGSIIHVFVAALSRALPHMSAERLVWRTHFALSTVTATMSGTRFEPATPAQIYSEIVPFILAGLQAPTPAPEERAQTGSRPQQLPSRRSRQELAKRPD